MKGFHGLAHLKPIGLFENLLGVITVYRKWTVLRHIFNHYYGGQSITLFSIYIQYNLLGSVSHPVRSLYPR